MKKITLILSIFLFSLVSCSDNEAKRYEDEDLQLILDEIDCEYPTFIDQNEYPYFFKKFGYENGNVMINDLVYKVSLISENRFALMAEEGVPFEYFEFRYIKSVSNHGLKTPAQFEIKRVCRPFQPSIIIGDYVITLMDYYDENPKPRVNIRIEAKSNFAFVSIYEFNYRIEPEDLIFVDHDSFYQIELLVHVNERIQIYKYSQDGRMLEFQFKTLTMADMFGLN